MSLSFEDYVKTAATPDPSLLGRAGKYIAAHPWKTGLGAAGVLGAGALGAHLLGGGGEEPAEIEEAPVGSIPDVLLGAGVRGVGGALTGGISALGRSALTGARHLWYGRQHGPVLAQVMAADPILSEADPEQVDQLFSTMRRFAPTLASDPYAVQSFLREAVTTGGGINYNTIKLLSEAEKATHSV